MNHYPSSGLILIVLVISLTISWTSSYSIKNGSSLNIRRRISAQADKLRNISSGARDRFPSRDDDNDDDEPSQENDGSTVAQRTSVVAFTSLSGIYVWWPMLFGGDDSFHLLLTQEDVPRFHDVTGDSEGNIYLTAPHERNVYRLKYVEGWWIANFSNHSVMNSIRSEMPLFLNIHQVSSILYVYGHTDIQIIDLLERPQTRGSAPFMKRLRELSPSLRISDMIIDQVTSDGYIIGDSYGWCTVIRCSLTVNECSFLFKIPSSYDNRPYPCTATIDFGSKIIYLSLEEKILGVHLNEQTHFDRRFVLTEKRGPRSTLGYDDIVTYQQAILYTDVLRPLLHICTLTNSNPCLNVSLAFPPPQRPILPLRLSIIQVSNLRPPIDEDDGDELELHINQTTTVAVPLSLIGSNKTAESQRRLNELNSTKPYVQREASISNIWVLLIGISLGLLIAGLSFMIYYILCNKNRPKIKQQQRKRSSKSSTDAEGPFPTDDHLLADDDDDDADNTQSEEIRSITQIVVNPLIPSSAGTSEDSSTTSRSVSTTVTSSSTSYRPETVL